MGGTWSGAFSNELVASTPHQATGGVRAAIDMGSLGDVVVTAPPDIDNTSFSVWFLNPNRDLLTIQCSHPIQIPSGSHSISLMTRLKNGVIGFTFINNQWAVSDFIPFEVPEGITAAVTWTPQAANGLCTLVDSYRMTSVERTANGKYTITTDGVTIDHHLLTPVCRAMGLGVNDHPQLTVTGWTATTIDLITGSRNQGGVFVLDDLDADPANTISIKVTEFA